MTRRIPYLLLALALPLLFLGILTRPSDPAAAASRLAPNACPGLPGAVDPNHFPDIIESDHVCLYYDGADTPDHANGVISHVEAQYALGIAEYAYERYVDEFGFTPPPTDATGKRMYWIYRGDEADIVAYLNFGPGTGCNGVSRTSLNVMGAWTGCFNDPEEQVYGVSAHEMFHGVQIGHNGGNETGWLMEGTARTMEDLIFSVLDTWPQAMSASFSFNRQADLYLGATNKDLTANPNRYDAALWWKFFTEQYGTTAVEPEYGVDAMLALWQATETTDDIAAINLALSNLGAGVDFHTAYRRFVIANWTKDLDQGSLPDASYYYVDEQQAGNPDTFGPITPINGGNLSLNNPVQWTNQNISRYGAAYYSVTPAANCPVVTAALSKGNQETAFYHLVAQDGTALVKHTESSAASWSQSFLNSSELSRVVAAIGSLQNSSSVDIDFSCADPVIDIKLPVSAAPAYVGDSDAPGKFLVQLLVTGGGNAPVVAGLAKEDFRAEVNGISANIVAGGFIQEQYWLEVQAPNQGADGVYDLEVWLEEPGSNTVIASDTSADSVIYDPANNDQVLVIDRSGSMSESDKMPAARDAANLYVDISRDGDGLAVVPFNGNVSPPPFDMQTVDAGVRTQARNFILGLAPSGATSIGDGLHEAAGQRTASPTGNPRCSFVLLSDGMENTAQYWADVQAAVIATGCPVTTIAFGPSANETLMQTIATATGGLPFYNDVSVGGNNPEGLVDGDEMALALADTYEYAQARAEGRQRFFAESGELTTPWVEEVHPVPVDESVAAMLFALDWNDPLVTMRLRLRQPDGVIVDPTTTPYTFVDWAESAHLGWRIDDPLPGEWEMLVSYMVPGAPVKVGGSGEANPFPYRVLAGGHSNLTVELLLPSRLGTSYLTGNKVPIYALVAGNAPIVDGVVTAFVTAPNGAMQSLELFDDGEHDDGAAGDGLFGNWYTAVNQASIVLPGDEGVPEPPANDEGAYRVKVVVTGPGYRREALGAFAVLEGPDGDGDGLPDTYEAEHGVDDPNGDPDLDGLTTRREYELGSDPNDPDTDDGGENDGSEFSHGQDLFDPADDLVAAPEFFHVVPADDAVIIYFDVKPQYQTMALYRADNPGGPWTLYDPDIGLTGHITCTWPCAANGRTRYYQLAATSRAGRISALLASDGILPSTDPIPPEAIVIVNDHAPTTAVPDVQLTFAPVQGETEGFDDIAEVLLSNRPDFSGAVWQPFAQGINWSLDAPAPGELVRIYARFRDDSGNESTGIAIGYIRYRPPQLFLPAVVR